MLKALKSYWAFTHDLYKLVMLVLTPILLVIINIYLYANDVGSGLECFLILYGVDTISDLFFMNGLYKKSNDSLEFLQSSSKFQEMMREIVIVDIVRRVLIYHIPYFVILGCSIGNPEAMEWCRIMAVLPWLEVLTAQVVILVARHYVAWNQVYACVAIGYIIMLVLMIFIMLVNGIKGAISEVGMNAVLMVLVLIASIGTVWYTDKKVRESYYD